MFGQWSIDYAQIIAAGIIEFACVVRHIDHLISCGREWPSTKNSLFSLLEQT